MSTLNQLLRRVYPRRRHAKAAALLSSPQKKGDVYRPMIITPKKPNSARRPAVKVFFSSGLGAIVHIPGSGHNLRRHSDVLVRGGGARDLPGVNYTCIRGAYDLLALKDKIRRRSVYGVKRPAHKVTKLRRKFRSAVS